ncbi:MAG: Crp/Fnr family transcriptional regulator [Micavibrio sp.]
MPFFEDLAETAFISLLHAVSIRNYLKNRPLFHQGDEADRIFVILSGWVKLFRNTIEGEEVVIALFTRGDVFGEAAVFGGGRLYPFSAQAIENTRLIEIPATLIQEIAKTDPAILTGIMKSMSREMHRLQIENEHLAVMSAPQRVGCLLLQLSSDMIGKGGTFSFPYDKSLAAQRLGMKPETFSRALSQLRPAGVVSKGTDIHIESFQCLSEYVCRRCSAEPEDCKWVIRKSCSCACSRKAQAAG